MGTAKRASAHTSSTKLARPLDVHHAEAMLRLPVENIGSSQHLRTATSLVAALMISPPGTRRRRFHEVPNQFQRLRFHAHSFAIWSSMWPPAAACTDNRHVMTCG
jgi:hypothetical protein